MSNKISRRTFLKVTGASAAALGAAAVLGGCQAGDNSSIEVKAVTPSWMSRSAIRSATGTIWRSS